MLESWLLEMAKGIGRFFMNPLFYWSIILIMLAGYFRMKKERINFGSRVYDIFSEWKHTWGVSIISGLLISVVMLGIGAVFSYETLLLLMVVVFLFSLALRFSILSASYTIGVTYILLMFMPYIISQQTLINHNLFSHSNLVGLAILLGLLLLVEALLILRTRSDDTLPSLVLSKRGGWIGQHHIKKLSLIPIFLLIPGGLIEPIAPYWPMLSIGSDMYGIVLFPFIIGFDYKVIASLPVEASKRIGKKILLLSLIVILVAFSSLYSHWLSLASVVIAIIGKELITYMEKTISNRQAPYFYHENKGLRIMGIIPSTPADRLNFLVGERIIKVNNQSVNSMEEFYKALQNSGSFFKIDILDHDGEVRFIKSAFYEGDHHKLGLIFTTSPYFEK